MNRKDFLLATLIAAAGMAMTAAPVHAGKLVFNDEPVPGQYIVVLKEESARLADEGRSIKPEVASVARDLSRAYRFEIRHSYSHVLRGFSIQANDKVLERLLLDDRVAYIEENGIARTSATTQPNATWGLDRVDQRDLPLNGTYVYDTAASNVHAYIVDTGIRASHNEFGGRVGSGYSAINDGNGTHDCNGHGTMSPEPSVVPCTEWPSRYVYIRSAHWVAAVPRLGTPPLPVWTGSPRTTPSRRWRT